MVVGGAFLRWRSRTYTITSHRLLTGNGIVRRSGHNVALSRVLDVRYERTLVDRLLGCGTLVVHTAAEGALVLEDIPAVRHVHRVLTELTLTGSRHPDGEVQSPHRSAWADESTAVTVLQGPHWPGPPAASWPGR